MLTGKRDSTTSQARMLKPKRTSPPSSGGDKTSASTQDNKGCDGDAVLESTIAMRSKSCAIALNVTLNTTTP
jgi:hypothetical protein